MKTLLPLLYQRMMTVLPDHSLPAVTLQHHILKIFYATMQVGRRWEGWGGRENGEREREGWVRVHDKKG